MTALSILGLVPDPPGRILESSSIRLRGEELVGAGEERLRRLRGNEVSMIFQEPMTSLNPVFTVGEQIAEPLRLHRAMDRRRAGERSLELLREVGISEAVQRFDEYPHQLSGGMRQRVMIAMALACEPALLVADESTTALDVTIQAQILELLAALRERHRMAVLLITHDLGVVAEVAHRVVVMYAGQVAETGTAREVFGAPAHPYTEGLLASLPRVDRLGGRLRPIPGVVPTLTAWSEGCCFTERCPHAWERGRTEPPPPARRARGGRVSPAPTSGASLPAVGAPTHVGEGPRLEEAFPDAELLLEVRGLVKHFPLRRRMLARSDGGRVRAVDAVSFWLRRGETLGLVGESGCGKTTTGRAILRLIEPTAEEIRFRREEVRAMDGEALRASRRRAQIVFQDPFGSLNPRLTVGAMLDEVLHVHRLGGDREGRRRRVAELLERVGLRAEHVDRYPHEFSGGQRQRLGIARSLAVEPELLVLDESVSALDVSVRAQVVNLLDDLQTELELTYLIIAHHLALVEHVSDRVAVMYLGRIVESALAADLYRTPRHPYTRALLSAVPRPDPGVTRAGRIVLAGDVPSPVSPPPGCPFHPRCPHPGKDMECARLELKGPEHFAACIKVAGDPRV